MRRTSILHPASPHRPPRVLPAPMAHPVVEPSRARNAATFSRATEPTTPPPPYDFHDAFSVVYTPETRLNPLPKAPDAVSSPGEISRTQSVTRPRSRTTPNLSIPHLREALHSLESKMASLLTERDLLESRLEQAVRMQSPIQRLPNELLASIFVIGVLDREEEDSLMLSTLMLVCRYWREVAVNTPMLWSRIVTGTNRSLERARMKLERSKSVPLHVCVDFSREGEHGTIRTESIMHALDLLRPAIWRWQTFHLTVPNRPQAHAALTRCKEPAPLLEVLSVRILHSMQEDHYSNPPLPLFDRHTPRLRSCSFTSFHFNWDLGLVSQLRVLKLGGYWNGFSPSIDVILGILRACPLLEELALRNMSDVDPESCALLEADPVEHDGFPDKFLRVNDMRTIQLPRLVKASFYYSGILRTRTILSLLSLPALERIELCFLDNVSSLIEHLRRQSLTSLPLHHLRIESSFFNELKLVRLLLRLPALVSLELVDVEDVSPNLLKGLSTPPVSHTWVCPKLTSLSLEGCTTLDWEALRSFVESRLPAQSRAFPRQLIPHNAVVTSTASASLRPSSSSRSSASEFAAHASILSHIPTTTPSNPTLMSLGWPQRLHSIDLTRCHQITKEMVQWLRMYVEDVKYETAQGVWGEHTLA